MKRIKVIFDGVFNHTGRDFFAFKDIQEKRQNSPYVNWYCNVNFSGNTEYNDGFSYENWGGYNLLVKLNQRNPDVQNYICDVIRFWVSDLMWMVSVLTLRTFWTLIYETVAPHR